MGSHSLTHKHTHTPEGRRDSQALVGSQSTRICLPAPAGPVGNWAPSHRCEFVTAGEQRAATQGAPAPPLAPLELLSFVHPGRHLFGFANILIHRNSRRGWGWGLGWRAGCPAVFIQAFSSPHEWQQHSRDMQWCASTIHTTNWTWPATVAGGLWLLQVWALSQSSVGLVRSEGPHSHRVEEGQVLGPFDWQLSGGIVVDDFRDTVERGAVLTQNVLLFGFGQFHVHKALVAPANKTRRLLGSAE